jgi:plastocyanin
MVTKSSILGLIAALAVVLIAVSVVGEDANNQIPKIYTVEEWHNGNCVETGCYTPSILTIKSGTIVTMTNTAGTDGIHTFTSGIVDEFEPKPNGMFDSGALLNGESYERKFSQKGTFDYYCTLHTWMTGQIIVE